MKESQCRICCGVLFQAVSVDAAGNLRLVTDGNEIECETYGTNYYISCPHCAAWNIAIRMYNSPTSLELDILAAVTEED